jgi:hypothetical protein
VAWIPAPEEDPMLRVPTILLALLLGMTVLATALPAHAAVVVNLGLPQLSEKAALVVRGTVEASQASWDSSGKRIVTRTSIRIAAVLKGTATNADGTPLKTVEVVTPGGVVGNIGQRVPGAARFVVGEEVVLFLESLQSGWTTLGLALGKFSIRPDDRGVIRAVRELDDLSFPVVGAGTMVDHGAPGTPPEDLPLDDLLRALRRE